MKVNKTALIMAVVIMLSGAPAAAADETDTETKVEASADIVKNDWPMAA